jgi:hypothetical protein
MPDVWAAKIRRAGGTIIFPESLYKTRVKWFNKTAGSVIKRIKWTLGIGGIGYPFRNAKS